MKQLKEYILSQVASQQLSKEKAKGLLMEMSASPSQQHQDMAIIGMACRFPQSNNAEQFWEMLSKGVNCVREFPQERKTDNHMLKTPFYSEFATGRAIAEKDINNVHSKAGYLDEIDKFDASFFGIPPAEAVNMDPNHRMALEVAWEAMEDAGYGGDALKGSKTGVYIGKEGTNLSYYRQSSEVHPMQLTGSWESLIASRISYLLDFKSPSMMVDTACSAGAVSVHLAIQALKSGDCDIAIAGGINLSVNGELKAEFQGGANMSEVESQEGLVRTFDAKANGTVWGEGVGIVILKPLEQAIKDNDHIRAVIKGSAINNDGASSSITAPKAETQEAVIIDAWEKAGIEPETITYVEAHGTGTVLGDPIEAKGLTNSFRQFTDRKQFCAIGSLKTNTGHLVGASGIASLIKVVKSLEHKQLAPTINFQTPNPYINFVDSPLYVNDTLQHWHVENGPRRAALSSFGFSRTNCHMVIEEAPVLAPSTALQPLYCLTISAKNEESFMDYIDRYDEYVQSSSNWTLADLCYTSNIGRGHYEHRAVIVASTKEGLLSKIRALKQSKNNAHQIEGVYTGSYQIVSEQKQSLEQGELTKHSQSKLCEIAKLELQRYIDSQFTDPDLLMNCCLLYTQGADVDWARLYSGEARRRISAPVYPLRRTRYWSNPKVSKVSTEMSAPLHPMVERQVTNTVEEICYETKFSVAKHWTLSDHRIGDKAVLPGTSYLEMARFAAVHAFGQERLEFSNVFFLTPLIVEDGEEVLTRLVLKMEAGDIFFTIKSSHADDEWVSHAEGYIKLGLPEAKHEYQQAEVMSLISSIKAQAEQTIDPYVGVSKTEVFTFGPHWDAVRAVWQNGNDTLACLHLPGHLVHETKTFALHPSIMDNAVNLTSQISGETYLPFMYKQLNVYAPFAKEMYTHIRLQPVKSGGETMTYDVDLYDADGKLLSEIRDYTVKRVNDFSMLDMARKESNVLQMEWVLREAIVAKNEKTIGSLALISTKGARSLKLEAALKAYGIEIDVFYVDTDADANSVDLFSPDANGFNRILDIVEQRGINSILYATGFTMEDNWEMWQHHHASFTFNRKVGIDGLFLLSKQMLNRKNKHVNTLKVLVRNGSLVDGSEADILPLSAAMASFARVISQEYRHLNVDILDASEEVDLQDVMEELLQRSGCRSLRPSGVYVEQLKSRKLPVSANLQLQTDGVYVITGGLGGLGLAVANRLASKGKAHVVLVGRSAIESTEKWESLANSKDESVAHKYSSLVSLQSKLGSLEYVALDVSNEVAVSALGADLLNRYGTISGIFHAAGVPGNGYIILKEEQQYNAVLNPKLDGAVNLMRMLANSGSGFMALFSSILAVVGGEGQGDYSAANTFLDALADRGRLLGLNVTAMNWPTWEEVGMAFNIKREQEKIISKNINAEVRSAVEAIAFLDFNLFSSIQTEEGLDWLEYSIGLPHHRLIPAKINSELALDMLEELPFKLSSELMVSNNALSQVAISRNVNETVAVDVKIRGVMHPSETQSALAQAFGQLLGMHEIDIYASFQDMGGNSLMSTQLLRQIDKLYPGMVDISDLFSYPSVNELSLYIDSRREIKLDEQLSNNNSSNDTDAQLASLIAEELVGTEFFDTFMEQFNGREKGD